MSSSAIEWTKRGRIFVPSGEGFFKTHATRPVPYRLSEKVLRIFYSSRDHDDRMLPAYLDVDIDDPSRVLDVSKEPLVAVGEPGTFDDSGVTLGSIVEDGEKVLLYYTGWKRRRVVSFELSIGLLQWDRHSGAVRRVFRGPILAQDRNHPFLVAGPFVLHQRGRYRMWYCSGTGWISASGNTEPLYTVFHAESGDGVNWEPSGTPVIPYSFDGEVVSAPWVVKSKDKYLMWYSSRGSASREAKNYVIGYAESEDGMKWQRMDDLAGIGRSTSGWDSEMTCYPSLYRHRDQVYMFYSGNGVGRDGIGYAVARDFLS